MDNRMLKVEIIVYVDDYPIPLRCAYAIKAERISDALQPIRTNDDNLGYVLEGRKPMENTVIKTARQNIAEELAHDITSYLINVEFAKNDTHNGYKKNEC